MGDMIYVIPTFKRRDNQKTLNTFLEVGISPILVGNSKADIPEGFSNFTLFRGKGIRGKRQFIYNKFSKEGKVMMMDDDLRFSKRLPNGKTTSDFDFRELLEECNELSDLHGISGTHPRFMWNRSPDRWKIIAKVGGVVVINRDRIPNPENLKYRLETSEDHDFNLQLISQGGTSAVTCMFSHAEKENAKGGCSEWRKDPSQDVDNLVRLWPGYVSKKSNGRPVIQFKKLWKDVNNET